MYNGLSERMTSMSKFIYNHKKNHFLPNPLTHRFQRFLWKRVSISQCSRNVRHNSFESKIQSTELLENITWYPYRFPIRIFMKFSTGGVCSKLKTERGLRQLFFMTFLRRVCYCKCRNEKHLNYIRYLQSYARNLFF